MLSSIIYSTHSYVIYNKLKHLSELKDRTVIYPKLYKKDEITVATSQFTLYSSTYPLHPHIFC